MNKHIPPPDIVMAINIELMYLKMVLDTPEKVIFVEREKNLNTFAKLGITVEGCFTYLKLLNFHNYVSGPSDDIDTGEKNCVWVFGTEISGISLYLKVKNEAPDRLKILSFHEAERPIKYIY